ncbi:hypothetical protein Taro_026922 [Colocasia esculenta]|uniref:Uncharacterized protein n=1 Tax=Colocasia esculenta TaxID=4460 RepID=A0A843VIK0_COLES|nr:hypothetical protein [Colocasia esculenta]
MARGPRLQLLLCRVRGECGRSACSCHSGVIGAGLADSGLPCVEDACEPVQVQCSWSSLAHLSVCASRRLREPACGVAFTGAGMLPVEPVEGVPALLAAPLLLGCVLWLLCVWPCVPVRCARDAELSSEVLLEFFSVGSGGSEVSPGLTVLCSFLLLPCYLRVEVCCWFGWCVLEGFSQSGALVVLVEVLPGPACVASAVLLAAVFSLMCAVWLGCVLVRFSQNSSWHFGEVCFGIVGQGSVRLAVRLAAALASLSRSCFQVSRLRRWDFVCPRASSGLLRCSPRAVISLWHRGSVDLFVPFVVEMVSYYLPGQLEHWVPVGLVRALFRFMLGGASTCALEAFRVVVLVLASLLVVIEVVHFAFARQGVAAVFAPSVAESVLRVLV